MMDLDSFRELVRPVAQAISECSLDAQLEDHLGALFPPDGDEFNGIESACREAIAAGWMCTQGGPGRRFGRVIEPGSYSRILVME